MENAQSVLTLAFCLGALVLGALKPGRKWFAAILLAMDMIFAFLYETPPLSLKQTMIILEFD
jgi:hypothetical protein